MPNDGDSRAKRNVIDERSELLGDASNSDTWCVRKRCDASSCFTLEARPHRAEDSGARQKPMHEHHDIVARLGVGDDGRQVARHERHLAQQGKSFDAHELAQCLAGKRTEYLGQSHLGETRSTIRAQRAPQRALARTALSEEASKS
jgi:hypothetical protein